MHFSLQSDVIYLKVENSTSIQVNFICAKTKITLLKKLTILCLELTTAVLLIRLVGYPQSVRFGISSIVALN